MKITILFIAMLFSSFLFAQKRDTTIYILKAHIEDFAFLRSALQHPEDVTPKQDSLMVRWIEGIEQEKAEPKKIK